MNKTPLHISALLNRALTNVLRLPMPASQVHLFFSKDSDVVKAKSVLFQYLWYFGALVTVMVRTYYLQLYNLIPKPLRQHFQGLCVKIFPPSYYTLIVILTALHLQILMVLS